MAYPVDQSFPFPSSPPLERYVGAEALKTYLDTFFNRQGDRPGRKFADADITEFLRLAEHLGKVTDDEMHYIRKTLLEQHVDLFKNEAQKARFRIFLQNHGRRNDLSEQDDFLKEVLRVAPISYFRDAEAFRMMDSAVALRDALFEARKFYVEHASDSPALVARVNDLSDKLAVFIEDFSLSDVDDSGREGREARRRNLANYFRRMNGEVDHEAKWDEESGTWRNWNREISIYPKSYIGEDFPRTPVQVGEEIATHDPIRVVAGGHAFNTSSDTGGEKGARVGFLITLDKLVLEPGRPWKRIPPQQAQDDYGLADGEHVVRVSAGMRLRALTAAMWDEGMALPVAGSTDAQSIGGLIATDLHSTGRSAGFLSQQLLEVVALDAQGRPHTFRRDDGVAHGMEGRWIWSGPNGVEALRKLPPAGGIGMTGVVVEAVVKLEPAFNFEKQERFIDRRLLEASMEEFLRVTDPKPDFDYPHVSMYYTGGFGADRIQSVQLNTWRRTADIQPPDALRIKRERELFDHVGSAFFPQQLFGLAQHEAPSFPDNLGGHDILRSLSGRDKQVLQANYAFARKLYFQHDEIESGIALPLLADGTPSCDRFRAAIKRTQELLKEEEIETIIEVRFTPDTSEAMLGPGTGGATCYIELATSMALYSRDRIVQAFHEFDTMLRQEFQARPHLGKKTSVTAADMATAYGDDWETFNRIRQIIDPGGKFLPAKNELLQRLFG